VFFMGLASAFTGAVLYAYYESRLERTEQDLDAFTSNYTDEFDNARGELQAEVAAGRERIDELLDELDQFAAGGEALTAIASAAEPSVWALETLDETGAPSVGSAFVVFSDPSTSFFLTTFTAVRAAAVSPGPPVRLRKADQLLDAAVVTWDEARDLALVSLPLGGLPALRFVEDATSVAVGDRLFILSGFGTTGTAISQGVVADVSGNALQLDAAVGVGFRGGPVLDADGRVVAVASRNYFPLGFDPVVVPFVPPIALACESVITCPGGTVVGP
jgi:S1-C subfamily serine protease